MERFAEGCWNTGLRSPFVLKPRVFCRLGAKRIPPRRRSRTASPARTWRWPVTSGEPRPSHSSPQCQPSKSSHLAWIFHCRRRSPSHSIAAPGEFDRCAGLENGFDHGFHGFRGSNGEEGRKSNPRVPAPFFIRAIREIRGPSGTTGWTRNRSQKPFCTAMEQLLVFVRRI